MKLIKASIKDYPIIQNMSCFYVYDMSRYCGDLPGYKSMEDGLFRCLDLKRYFEENNRHPFLIRVKEEIAGFIMVNKIGSTLNVDWNMGEFFVLAKFQGKGIGEKAAIEIFKLFLGIWEVPVIPENSRALQFWRKVIKKFTLEGNIMEVKKVIDYPEPHPMIIFRFESTDQKKISETEMVFT
jgi:predicted acetyltransferase